MTVRQGGGLWRGTSLDSGAGGWPDWYESELVACTVTGALHVRGAPSRPTHDALGWDDSPSSPSTPRPGKG